MYQMNSDTSTEVDASGNGNDGTYTAGMPNRQVGGLYAGDTHHQLFNDLNAGLNTGIDVGGWDQITIVVVGRHLGSDGTGDSHFISSDNSEPVYIRFNDSNNSVYGTVKLPPKTLLATRSGGGQYNNSTVWILRWDGQDVNNNVRLSENGTEAVGNGEPFQTITAGVVHIGGTPGRPCFAEISSAAIYNKYLTFAQVQQIHSLTGL